MAYKEDVLLVNATQAQQPFTEEEVGFVPGSLTMHVEDQNVRFWVSGRTPTPTEGLRIFATGGAILTSAGEIMNLKIISETGTAKVNYSIKGR